jgi:hypothetical protein
LPQLNITPLEAQTECLSLVIEIGDMPVRVNTSSPEFARVLSERYSGFAAPAARYARSGAEVEFYIELSEGRFSAPDAPVRVTQSAGHWRMTRGDFRAEWDPRMRRGTIRQSANPYSIDAVLRIVHTLALARQGGMLLHAASAIRNGKAFVFAGVSGAGKTTISRLAPSDVTLLTDEISYVRKSGDGYIAFGTPFTGELAKLGENVSAPLAAVYFLEQGPANRIESVPAGDAIRSLLANVLFFAEEPELVRQVFQSACELVERIAVARLTFMPDSRVWEMIQ